MARSVVIGEDYQPELVDRTFDSEGDVTLEVTYSSLNYKDAMALSGDKSIVRTTPLVPGIDAIGRVVASDSSRFEVGDVAIVNGAGLGERRHGGFTTQLKVDSDSTVKLPSAFTSQQAGALGTAGFTAALSVQALEAGVASEDGPVLVTGSTGGVGSVACYLLSAAGYHVVAATGRKSEHENFLRDLGVAEIIDRSELSEKGKPLQSQRWAGVVDAVGSTTLANALAQTRWGGTVTACGLAQGADLPTTVLPFILRGVHLSGVNSVDAPLGMRESAWDLLAEKMNPEVLDSMTTVIDLGDLIQAGKDLFAGKLHGRTAVRVSTE